ncbi:replicative DNA helicase [Solibacillus isronensis]|uniref:replicative DNA helicase n=1 Tax=Solibacillus isronensis TaxID=412383 RepID=UPI00203ECE63|nr:replicative DNA helicase [Solibacillus isronensis]MCM3722095.1 replicative DNA helicase [Solibacillus isronensis]
MIKKEFLEQSILATMLEENYLIMDSQLKPEMFYGQHHRQLFMLMQQLVAEGHPVDYLTLSARFEQMETIGLSYVTELMMCANAEKFDEYARLLREIWRERQKAQILFQAAEGDWAISQIIERLDYTQLEGNQVDTSITQDLVGMHNRPWEDVETPGLIVPHIQSLASIIDGFRPGELTIIAARPSMGKTDVMNNIALQAGWQGHLPIIFSLEMSKTILLNRLIATSGPYSRLKMRNPKQYFSEDQKNKWLHVLENVNKSSIHIDDRSSLTMPQIRSQSRRIIRQNPNKTPVILIDYLQIIQTDGDHDYPAMAMGKISRALKQMAKEFNCPVICLSQLNRNVETRSNKRPVMSDLRDSGSIEQDADVIILLYRNSYYETEKTDAPDLLEFIVAKNRNGPTDTAKAIYNKKTGHIWTRSEVNA